MLRVLLAEDDPDAREGLSEALTEAGHDVVAVADGIAAEAALARERFDVLLTDVRMPRMDGIALFTAVRRLHEATDVILMTSFSNVADAVSALKNGARDYLTKPFETDELLVRLGHIAEHRALRHQLLEAQAALRNDARAIVGAAPPLLRLLERVAAVATSDAPVLITGESGTGKELFARRLHEASGRPGPFVAVNCAAIPEALLEAELFGHERGAFTGAVRKREGRFRAAAGGTLFLDEIGDLPLSAQAKLLRVLQEGTIEPVGSDHTVRVDVRLVSATHRDLRARIAEGAFRSDFFYRLNGVALHVPPLRDAPRSPRAHRRGRVSKRLLLSSPSGKPYYKE